MTITRPIPILQELLKNNELLLSEKLKLAIELHIASLLVEDQPKARQQLPFLVQFWPLAIKHRKDLSLLQRVNPTIAHGWFTEYEKHDVYYHFPRENQILSFDILDVDFPGKDKMQALHTESHCWFPCMVKADVWERGVGIHYVANQEKRDVLMDAYTDWTISRHPSTLQAYCGRPEEWCLQFYHHPENGLDIWSLVKRNLPFVVWDGKESVIALIHDLPLSPIQKEKIVTTLEKEEPELLEQTLPLDKQLTVIRKASIVYWTTYTDFTASLTAKQSHNLHTLLQHLLANLPLLSVWRFDLKAKSLESLLNWEVKIIECNAWWWIPTHVYDESLSIEEKYNILENHFNRMIDIAQFHKQAWRWAWTYFWAYRNIIKASYLSLKKKWIHITKSSSSKAHTLKIFNELYTLIRTHR